MRKVVIPLVLVGIVLFIIIFLITYNRDQRIIKKKLNSLADTISKSDNEGDLAFITKAGRLNSSFTQDCLIEVGAPIPRIEGLETLMAVFSHFQQSAYNIDVTFYDITVTVDQQRITARTVMTVKATGPDPNGGGDMTDAREIEMDWKKIDSTWKIARVSEIKTLH